MMNTKDRSDTRAVRPDAALRKQPASEMPRRSSEVWELVSTLLSKSWVEDIRRKTRKHFELSDDSTRQRACDAAGTVRGGSVPSAVHVRGEQRLQVGANASTLKGQEKGENRAEPSRREVE